MLRKKTSSGGHVPQALVLVFKTGFSFCRTQTQIQKWGGTPPSSLLQNRCNICFSLIYHRFYASRNIILTSSLTYDRLFEEFQSGSQRTAYKVPTELYHRILSVFP